MGAEACECDDRHTTRGCVLGALGDRVRGAQQQCANAARCAEGGAGPWCPRTDTWAAGLCQASFILLGFGPTAACLIFFGGGARARAAE